MIRKITKIIYIFIIAILATTTLMALYDGGYHIGGGVITGIAIGSTITSLIPFFASISLFKKYEIDQTKKSHFKIWG